MTICLATQHLKPAFLPLALLYLKACLVEREGRAADDVRILEFGPKAPVDEMVREILAAAADVVGLSCYVWNVKNLLAAATEVKQRRPGTRRERPSKKRPAHRVLRVCCQTKALCISTYPLLYPYSCRR